MTALAADLVPDQFGRRWRPCCRLRLARRTAAAPRHPGPQLLTAIVFMARTSTPWRLLPAQELGCGSPATVWRRLNQWVRAGRLGLQAELLITRLVLVMLTAERGDVGAFPAARQPTDRP
jgi:transposase